MGNAMQIVNRFYDFTNGKRTKGLEELLASDMTFTGPLMKASGAKQYIDMSEQLLPFHKGTRMLRQFENGNDVCSIYEMTLGTPSGGTISVTIADWIRVSNGKVAEQKIYYDPREFAEAFGMK